MLYFWYFHELIWLTHRNFYGLISCDVDMSYETALWSKLFLLFLSGRNCILNIYLRKREMISSLWRWGTQNLEWCSETKISNVCKIKAIHAVIFCIIRQLMSKGRALDLGFRINLPTKYLFISKVMCWQMKILHNVFPHNNYHWRCVFLKSSVIKIFYLCLILDTSLIQLHGLIYVVNSQNVFTEFSILSEKTVHL